MPAVEEAVTGMVPDAVCVPVQVLVLSVLDAVQTAVGSLEDQVSVMVPPVSTEAGLALMVTVGPVVPLLLPLPEELLPLLEELLLLPLPEELLLEELLPLPEELLPLPEELLPLPEELLPLLEEVLPLPEELVPLLEEVLPLDDEVPEDEAPEDAPDDVPLVPPLAEQPASAIPAVTSKAAAPRDTIPNLIVLFMMCVP